jgi:hypothetical protein
MNKIYHYATLLIIALFAANANSAPMAYSVNSDSDDVSTEDGLYLIDLATGSDQRRGTLFTGVEVRSDTEGLAFAPDGTLWGIDDRFLKLFPINTNNGSVSFQTEKPLSGIPTGGSNDFGMTFGCDGTLYITSVVTNTLYSLDLEGDSKSIGSLGANISAIAAIGNPTRLYGLGNGQKDGATDSPNLYSIDKDTGVVAFIGALGNAVGAYNQAGLAFDSSGDLWAITDRRNINNQIVALASQILSIDMASGAATVVSSTSEVGFESLAISPPAACSSAPVSDSEDYEGIPIMSPAGRLLAIFMLLLTGLAILRKRFF